MIFQNGFIRAKIPGEATFDERGNPIKQDAEWDNTFIPAMYQHTQSPARKTSEGSNYTGQTLTVTIALRDTVPERVALFDIGKRFIGEYIVETFDRFSYVDQLRLACKTIPKSDDSNTEVNRQ